MGHVLQFDPESRKSDDCAMNHGRCLWTNNENIISIYKAKEAAEIQKTKDKENRAIQRNLKLQSPDGAEPVEKKKRARSSTSSTGSELITVKKPRTVRCSNSSCRSSVPMAEKINWTKCGSKGCNLIFCDKCGDSLRKHRDEACAVLLV